MTEDRACKECSRQLLGRADQVFCSSDCRSAFHNKKKRAAQTYMKTINAILRKNRTILFRLNPNGKAKVTKSQLQKAGFDFNYYTNVYTTKKGHAYYFCYEQGYLPIEHDYYALVVRQDYVE